MVCATTMDLNFIRSWRAHFSPTNKKVTITLLSLAITFSVIIEIRHRNNLLFQTSIRSACAFRAIFNFGDSNSDGDTFFHKPSGRYFNAGRLGLPYLSAYLDSLGENFRHGANFVTGGSTIQLADSRIFGEGFSPISLDIQLQQFEQFKARSIELYNQDLSSYAKTNLPRPEDFAKALYTFDIGQNDLHFGFKLMTKKKILEMIPRIIDMLLQAVEVSFSNPFGYCYGHYGDYYVSCGRKVILSGTEIFGASCSDPSSSISWDGVHYSHAANKWVFSKILDGSHSNPPTTIAEACDKSIHL